MHSWQLALSTMSCNMCVELFIFVVLFLGPHDILCYCCLCIGIVVAPLVLLFSLIMHTYATHPTTTDPRCHPTSLQAVARDEAAQVSLLPEAVYLCTEATAATLGQTHSSGMQVRSPTIEQYAQEIALVSFDCYYFLVCEMC